MRVVAPDTPATGNGALYNLLEPGWNCHRVTESVVKDRQLLPGDTHIVATGERAADPVKENCVLKLSAVLPDTGATSLCLVIRRS